MGALDEKWMVWMRQNWTALTHEEFVTAPFFLPHPKRAGFKPVGRPEPSGYVADWVVSLNGGTRLYVNVDEKGEQVVHLESDKP